MIMMKYKGQVVFDIGQDKFKYLHREDNNKPNRVDIMELNKRLGNNKKKNFYSNAKIIAASSVCLGLIAAISINF